MRTDYKKEEVKELLQLALAEGGDFAEVYIEEKTVSSVTSDEKKIDGVTSGQGGGVGIRLIAQDKTYYAYSSDYAMEALRDCARTLAKACKNKKLPPSPSFSLGPQKKASLPEGCLLPDQVKVEEKIDLVKKADAFSWQFDERISQVKVVYGDLSQKVRIVNSLGEDVEDQRVRVKFIVQVVAKNDQAKIQSGFDAVGASLGFEFMQETDVIEVARTAARRALLMLEAGPAPAGTMPVVMSSEAGGTMVHEACGHGLEADLVEKGLSVYAGKLGQKVASDRVTVIDDGAMPGRYGSASFDDEGLACKENVLIEKGILRAYMTDRLTAKKMNIPFTGNGRRQSYQHKPVTRMTNTYIAPGKDDPDQIIAEVKKGFFAKKMGGGQVNTATGDFVFEVSEGYLIEDGKLTRPVKGATLTGNGPEVLMTIDRVGSDLGYSIGTCGKDGQGVAVADAQPTIRIPSLVVGGMLVGEEK